MMFKYYSYIVLIFLVKNLRGDSIAIAEQVILEVDYLRTSQNNRPTKTSFDSDKLAEQFHGDSRKYNQSVMKNQPVSKKT